MELRKNIVSVTLDNNGNVTSETADYIGVKAFTEEIYKLYKECFSNFEDKEEFGQYIENNLCAVNDYLMQCAEEFAFQANDDMKKYLHMDKHDMIGNFANVKDDYTGYRADGKHPWECDEYYSFFPNMVKRLDTDEDSERANDDREYLSSWFFFAFGTYNIKYNFSNDLAELHYDMEKCYEGECVPA